MWQDYHPLFRSAQKPFAFVDLDAFDANLQHLMARSGGLPVRVATKSVSCVDLMRRIAEQAAISRWMCFSAAEAVWLSEQGFDNLLVAYPILQPDDVRAVCRRIKAGSHIILMTDCTEHLDALNALAQSEGCVLPVAVDIDVSTDWPGLHFGVYRSPIKQAGQLRRYLVHLKQQPALRLAGAMTYDAQIAGLGDADPHKPAPYNRLVAWLKQRSQPKIDAWRTEAAAVFRQENMVPDFFNGGGTGSLEEQNKGVVTEVTFGSGLYSPALFDGYSGFRHRAAAGFVAELVRHPSEGVYTALGGGYIASGSPGWAKVPAVVYPPGARLIKDEGAGEVQTPLRVASPLNWPHDNFAVFRHAKAGELCERFNELVLLQGGRQVGSAATYRGAGKCFL